MGSRVWSVAVAVVLFGGVLFPTVASGALIHERLSVPELVSRADAIFIGKVLAVHCGRDSSHGEIYTIVTLEVQSELKGRASSDGSVRIRVDGGQVGNEIEVVQGAPRFAPEEDVLVFLSRMSDEDYQVLEMSQGKFSLRQDSYTGTIRVIHDLGGLYYLIPDRDSAAYRTEQAPAEEKLLSDLLDDIGRQLSPGLVMR